jgi:acyl carrier protein
MVVGRQDVVESILAFVRRRFAAAEVAGADTRLLEGGVIDSLGLIELMEFLQHSFGIDIADEDFSAENFDTVDTLAGLVERRRAA